MSTFVDSAKCSQLMPPRLSAPLCTSSAEFTQPPMRSEVHVSIDQPLVRFSPG